MNSDPGEVKISAILLAAGGSFRLGIPKQLLKWQGKPIISYILDQINQVGFYSTIVVLGNDSKKIEDIIGKRKLIIITNPLWQSGIGTSIRAGVRALPRSIDAVIIFVVDQPFLSSILIKSIINTYIKEKSMIVATQVNGIQTNPVLFDRCMFKALKRLKDDEGAKIYLNSDNISLLKWEDDRLLMDIDTIEDYHKLINEGYSSKLPEL